MSIDSYRRRLSAFGKTVREQNINFEQLQIKNLAPNSPAFKSTTINDIEQNLMVVRSGEIESKYIYSMPNETFDVGSVVYWNQSHWLITQKDNDDDIITRGVMELCNREISWQDLDDKEIYKLWATIKKPYYNNLSDSSRITVSNREFKIQMPYTNESSKINIGKRFMLEKIDGEPKTYQVTSVDSITDRYDRNGEITGFININVKQDLYNPQVDNAELMICDYIEPGTEREIETTGEANIFFKGSPTVKVGGSIKWFTGSGNGQWIVNSDFDPEIKFDDDRIGVLVKEDYTLVGKVIELIYDVNGDTDKAVLEVEVV